MIDWAGLGWTSCLEGQSQGRVCSGRQEVVICTQDVGLREHGGGHIWTSHCLVVFTFVDARVRCLPIGPAGERVRLSRVFHRCLDERTVWVHVYGQLCLCGNINVMIGWAEGL